MTTTKDAETEANRALQRRYLEELYVHRNIDFIDEAVSPDFVGWMFPEEGLGDPRDVVRAAYRSMWTGFPDLELVIDEVFAEGDLTCCPFRFRGTHLGEWNGIPATGCQVEIKIVDVNRVVDGKFVAAWPIVDMLGVLQQLGVAPDTIDPISFKLPEREDPD